MSASATHPSPPFAIRDWVVVALTVLLIASGVKPHDFLTWVLEISWVAAAIVMWWLWLRRLPVTTVSFALCVAHAVVLIIGGYYTYALVPAGAWMQELMHRPRNDYDRLGHFMQGFAPAMVWREVFMRNTIVRGRGWTVAIVIGMCLAFAAAFELLEFAVAMILGEASWAYLGSQGDIWDAQWDMLTCVVGAVAALVALSGVQDRGMGSPAAPARPRDF